VSWGFKIANSWVLALLEIGMHETRGYIAKLYREAESFKEIV
jgi:hypothetical protein